MTRLEPDYVVDQLLTLKLKLLSCCLPVFELRLITQISEGVLCGLSVKTLQGLSRTQMAQPVG